MSNFLDEVFLLLRYEMFMLQQAAALEPSGETGNGLNRVTD